MSAIPTRRARSCNSLRQNFILGSSEHYSSIEFTRGEIDVFLHMKMKSITLIVDQEVQAMGFEKKEMVRVPSL